MKYRTKVSKEWQERYNRALEHRRNAIMKVFRASPSIEKGASWFTTFFGGNKYKPDDVAFNRAALRGLVGQGLLIKTQKVYNGKIGNSYRLAPEGC